MTYAATKEQAHELLDRIDPAQVPIVVELMEKLLDPLQYALKRAPVEDEEISDHERAAAAKAEAEGYPGRTTHEEMLNEFGITADDVERYCGRSPVANGANR